MFGPFVSSFEAKNQQKAYTIIDPDIVTVPWVQDFFMDDEGWGYIISDFIQGKIIDPLTDSHILRLAHILEYFRSITADRAGSLCGGPSIGLLWPDTNDLTISNIQQVEEWFNSRLFPGDGKVHFDTTLLVLCHLDIAPRNIIWLDDSRVCLLDWASAGFYPRLLEFASLFFQQCQFGEMLLKAVGFGSGRDREEQQRICQALYNNERYSLYVRTD
ncbi:Protein kinase-like domain [Penicillium camemberti]|uniref:Protein kinase-like domain n=1 Tax=Penicillium camemberti (strain FM 013) TaxID=1429867 RepID=A0A0G4P7C8_PENC3|nr:Protein kinase-like domain [Penicillium camemberti]